MCTLLQINFAAMPPAANCTPACRIFKNPNHSNPRRRISAVNLRIILVLTEIHANGIFLQDLGRVVFFPAKKFRKRMKIPFFAWRESKYESNRNCTTH